MKKLIIAVIVLMNISFAAIAKPDTTSETKSSICILGCA